MFIFEKKCYLQVYIQIIFWKFQQTLSYLQYKIYIYKIMNMCEN
jgi:hypothetical protein